MSAARGSWRLGWAAASALLLAACQAVAAPTLPAAAPTAPATLEIPGGPVGATQQATVTDVVDGDTIHVEINGQEFRVRYIGIDTPEVAHDNNPGEPLGPEATQANADLVEGRTVILETDVSDTDQFGRLLRYVWLPPSADDPRPTWTMVNEQLAALGLADVRAYPPDTARQSELQAAEDAARAADLGIWAN